MKLEALKTVPISVLCISSVFPGIPFLIATEKKGTETFKILVSKSSLLWTTSYYFYQCELFFTFKGNMKVSKALWLRAWTLKPDSLELNPGSAIFWLYGIGQLLNHVCAFIFITCKMGRINIASFSGLF